MKSWTGIVVICIVYLSAGVIHGVRASEHKLAISSILNQCFTWECLTTASWISHNMNSSVDPCDDFYEFTCGRFGKHESKLHQYDKSAYDVACEEIDTRLKYLIEDIDKKSASKPFRLVKILYDNCMETGQLEEADATEDEIFEFYDKVSGVLGWPVISGSRWRSLAMSNRLILYALLDVEYQFTTMDTNYAIPQIKVGHHVLDAEILRRGFDNEIVQAYYRYMVDMAVILGAERVQAENELKEAVEVEIMLANDTLSEENRWIRYNSWDRMTLYELEGRYPNLQIREFLLLHATDGLYDDDIISVPKNFDNIAKIVSRSRKRILANLIQWYKVDAWASKLGGELRNRRNQYYNLFVQPPKPETMWQKCVETVKTHLDLSVSALYQRTYIDQKIISDVNGMANLIHKTFHEIVNETEWLDAASKKQALQKINNIIGHLSYRDEYKDNEKLEEFYKDLVLVDGDLQRSIANITRFLIKYEHKQLQKAQIRDDWTEHGNIFSGTASYKYHLNIYKIPATYLSTNIYDVNRAKFLNFAILGNVIAHEIAHSIDNNGMLYDSNGKIQQWLSVASTEAFNNRIQSMIEQYGNYTIDEIGLNLPAHRTLAENIADNVAAKAAYRAYLKWSAKNKAEQLLPSLPYTAKQMFWIGVGNYRCTNYRNLELMDTALTDEHSPAKFRINGALANSPEFATDFGCQPGSRMNPVKKSSVW